MNKEQLSELKYLKNEIEMLKKQMEDIDFTITTNRIYTEL